MQVQNNTGSPYVCEGVTLKPGSNDVPDKDWERMKAHPGTKARMGLGTVNEGPAPAQMAETLAAAQKRASAAEAAANAMSEALEAANARVTELEAAAKAKAKA